MTDEEKYLRFLGLPKSEATLPFLNELVRRHLLSIPYENISKMIRFHEVGPSIPSFGEFVEGARQRTYGGTCFAQNIHLNHILNALGFNSELTGIRRDGLLSHVSLRVKIEDSNYFVDAGLMSSFAGPFRIHPSESFRKMFGNQEFVFLPKSDMENYVLEIWRDGKIIRHFESTSFGVTNHDLEIGIQKTFERSAMFMTTLCVHRVFEGYSCGIWNSSFYKTNGPERSVREIQNYDELVSAFKDELKLPHYPLETVLDLLQRNGAPKIFEV